MAKKAVEVSEDQLLRELLAGFSIKKARVWLQEKFDAFDPEAGVAELAFLGQGLSADEMRYFKSIEPIGLIKGLPSKGGLKKPLVVAAVGMNKELTDRTSRAKQFALARKIIGEAFKTPIAGLGGKDVGLCTQGLFFFHDEEGDFRISLVTCGLKGKRLVSTTARRQSFFCSPNTRNNIVKRQLNPDIKSFEDLQKAFSVEGITKEFYNKLFAWYQWACDKKTGVTFPNRIHDDKDDRDKLPEAIIRLITRLMFTWFVRQKGLIPDDIFNRERVSELLNDDFNPDSAKDGTYYKAILQNLFFATLNCPVDDRMFAQNGDRSKPNSWACSDYRCTTKYRYKEAFCPDRVKEFMELMRQVPFLNCALFDCLDRRFDKELDADEIERNGGEWEIFTDGFSRRGPSAKSPSYQAFVPNCLFFYDKPNDEGRQGIISLFDQYEFTVDENTSDDSDVALDPELLGKVFENLLGAFNPETQEVARKSTGSFYTPREIVDYMTDESLKNYIKTKVPSVPEAQLSRLFDKNEECDAHVYLKPADLESILDALYSCKILDPACGSGAFPMGLLHRMTQLFDRLDNNCTSIRKKIRERYENDRKFISAADWMTEKERAERLADIEDQRQINLHHPDYTRKLFIIENCIYGVDIQPIATQIAKLRFFISLLCDQLRNHRETDENGNVTYKLLALPNLEAKFACANTLISLPRLEGFLDLSTPEITGLRKKLAAQRRRYFFARTYTTKQNAQTEERQIRREIKAAVKKVISTPDQHEIKKQTQIISGLEAEYENVREPKWITSKKPKQGDLFGGGLEQGELELNKIDVNAKRRSEIESLIAKARKAIAAEQAKATQAQTGSAGDDYAEQVANWNPYDQNASSPFFDPDWMFGIKDGFDIVIGNPPYVQLQGTLAKLYEECSFDSYEKTGDLYCLFYEKGCQLLCEGGRLCYITSNKWMRVSYGTKLRDFILRRTTPFFLLDFAAQKVFEAAMVDTNILMFGKNSGPSMFYACTATENCLENLKDFVRDHKFTISFSNTDSWALIPPALRDVKRKLEVGGRRLKDWTVSINYGIKTGLNDAYIIGPEEYNNIVKCNSSAKEILEPVLRGRDIKRYSYECKCWLIAAHNGVPSLGIKRVAISKYPSVKAYLDLFKVELEKRTDKGSTIYNLRDCAYWNSFYQKKIVWAELARTGNAFALDDKGHFLGNTGYTLTVPNDDELILKYLLAVLNSKPTLFYLDLICSKLDATGWRWLRQYVEQIPIPFVDNELMTPLKLCVDKILSAKKKDPNADTSALEAEIDQLVYKLYDLTPEEIAVVEGKGSVAKEPAAKRAGGKANGQKGGKECEVASEVATEEEYEELD